MSTEKPRPLQGYRESQEVKKDTPVDPKKFQEELSKVRESDAAQDQKKRNLKKSEEEGDDLLQGQGQPQQPPEGGIFSMFLSSSKSSGLSPQSPQNLKATPAPSASSSFNIEETPSASGAPSATAEPQAPPPSPLPSENMPQGFAPQTAPSQPSVDTPQEPPPLPSVQATPNIPDTLSAQDLTPSTTVVTPSSQSSSQGEAQDQSQEPSPGRIQKKEVQDTSLLAKKKPSVAQVAKQSKETTPDLVFGKKQVSPKESPSATKKAPLPLKKEPSTPSTPKGIPSTPSQKQQQPLPQESKQLLSQQQPQAAPIPAKPQAPLPQPASMVPPAATQPSPILSHADSSSQDQSKERKKEESTEAITAIQQPGVPLTAFTPPPPTELPAYATLTPAVYELFEKMVGLMTVEQGKGITTTTVTLSMKDSIFNGTQIVLDRYSTAPNTFHIQIATTPQAQDVLNAHMDDLVAAFQQSKLAFEVNLRKPILLEEYRDFKRKEGTGKEDNQKRQRQ